MKITELRPMMSTEGLNGTIDFHTNVLGLTCDNVNDDWGWAKLSIDD